MMLVLILLVIFGGITAIVYVDNLGKTARKAMTFQQDEGPPLPAAAAPSALPRPQADAPESLALRLPEPARTQAWALLCLVTDAHRAGVNGDTRTAYLIAQTIGAYLPDTLRAYLNLTDGARRTLESQGQPPETLLTEQLGLLEDGVREALRHDHATADRLLSQGRFLRERFGAAESELRLKPELRKG
ncbi:hypothetical protein ACFP9V_16360 [Deinococcus radiopugnans]|uniref:Uncharacterized protein n=1 Tax=Deinococcus radiopugnans ATCC 19172 TaxID=585398 RepID=A0A5C4XVR6_9DEIO|nr:hypothetical protein [Deinococcus radiopugnans]MBB6018473.1 hypothetical protein [Deinococcus radiopugnans ATCC 19172]TNM67521.1 hypothetical protein FHR04_18245 [Deinococcus radiopugnans ATCC 19172]